MKIKYNNSWHEKNYEWRRAVNQKYNMDWIKFFNFEKYEIISIDELAKEKIDIRNASQYQVVWLRNIDRLIELLPPNIQPNNYHLLDVGCGAGISTIYFYDNYPFKTFQGFDFSKNLLFYAKRNFELYSKKRNNKTNTIEFINSDARNYKLNDQPIFMFMYNPFEFPIAKDFLQNNLNNLRKNNSIIAIANDIYIEDILKLNIHNQIIRDSINNLSLIFF